MDKEQQKEYAIEIAEKVCNYYQIKYGQMMSKYRGEEVTLARQMTMYLTKEKTELNGEEIAQIFNRDRTTVLHSISKISCFTEWRHQPNDYKDTTHQSEAHQEYAEFLHCV